MRVCRISVTPRRKTTIPLIFAARSPHLGRPPLAFVRFPWLVLIPERAGQRELHDFSPKRRWLAIQEITRAGRLLAAATGAYKMNIAALGRLVAQLHIHVIGRFKGDSVLPNPVWAAGGAEPYRNEEGAREVARLAAAPTAM